MLLLCSKLTRGCSEYFKLSMATVQDVHRFLRKFRADKTLAKEIRSTQIVPYLVMFQRKRIAPFSVRNPFLAGVSVEVGGMIFTMHKLYVQVCYKINQFKKCFYLDCSDWCDETKLEKRKAPTFSLTPLPNSRGRIKLASHHLMKCK